MYLKPLYELLYAVGLNNKKLPEKWKEKIIYILKKMEIIYSIKKLNKKAPACLLECFVELYLIFHLYTSQEDQETKFKYFATLFVIVDT